MKTIAELHIGTEELDYDAWDYDFLHNRKKKAIMGFIDIYNGDPSVSFIVEFYDGVSLRYGRGFDDYHYKTTHEIKRIFRLGVDLFYIAGKMRKHGYEIYHEFYDSLKSITVLRK